MRLEDFGARADQLLTAADQVVASHFRHGNTELVDPGKFSGFRSAALSFLRSVFGVDHPYYKDFAERVDKSYLAHAKSGREIIAAAKNEVVGGWNVRIRSLVAAELFADFLDMARHLLETGYKDAAEVIVGSVLEEHLRQLCGHHSIETSYMKDGALFPKKADLINTKLAKAGVYGMLDQKSITGCLELRNKAAHGHYGEYNRPQVELMRQASLEFMARVSP